MAFWKWYDRAARLDFATMIASFLFDWRSWILTFVPAIVGAITFLMAAIDGRSVLDVWVFAVVVTAGLFVIIYILLYVWERYLQRPYASDAETIKKLDDLVAEGTAENNRLIRKLVDYNDDYERARFGAWQTKVLDLLKNRPKAYSEIRTLHRFNGQYHREEGKSSAQEQLEAIWTETVMRLRAIIKKL